MTAATSIDRRVADLEADAFRGRGRRRDVGQRLDHLTDAIGDLSQDGRALAFDVREIRTELHEVHVKVDDLSAKFDAVDAKFDAVDAKVDALSAEVRAGFATLAAALENRLAPGE